jgi:hypothetical protein
MDLLSPVSNPKGLNLEAATSLKMLSINCANHQYKQALLIIFNLTTKKPYCTLNSYYVIILKWFWPLLLINEITFNSLINLQNIFA